MLMQTGLQYCLEEKYNSVEELTIKYNLFSSAHNMVHPNSVLTAVLPNNNGQVKTNFTSCPETLLLTEMSHTAGSRPYHVEWKQFRILAA